MAQRTRRRSGKNPGPPWIDPDIAWNLGPGRADYFGRVGQQAWIPVLLQLGDISPGDFADGAALFDKDVAKSNEWRSIVFVPPLYTKVLERFDKLPFITALVREPFFSLLEDEKNVALRHSATN